MSKFIQVEGNKLINLDYVYKIECVVKKCRDFNAPTPQTVILPVIAFYVSKQHKQDLDAPRYPEYQYFKTREERDKAFLEVINLVSRAIKHQTRGD